MPPNDRATNGFGSPAPSWREGIHRSIFDLHAQMPRHVIKRPPIRIRSKDTDLNDNRRIVHFRYVTFHKHKLALTRCINFFASRKIFKEIPSKITTSVSICDRRALSRFAIFSNISKTGPPHKSFSPSHVGLRGGMCHFFVVICEQP